eukprot:TRINITY_DN9245_c1_g1_i3.p3 TRINITY_DN9245_c1_g1~~TRINITY_DN9245_c1_g1_i3.p3  ORF type:complete len:125 (-),score=4.73 TRINITY_DN9245_c1_g1_i3:23-397(-)
MNISFNTIRLFYFCAVSDLNRSCEYTQLMMMIMLIVRYAMFIIVKQNGKMVRYLLLGILLLDIFHNQQGQYRIALEVGHLGQVDLRSQFGFFSALNGKRFETNLDGVNFDTQIGQFGKTFMYSR